jgi:hypothetical protein
MMVWMPAEKEGAQNHGLYAHCATAEMAIDALAEMKCDTRWFSTSC